MSKRNLYKPAPSQTPPRVSRKSLTQGRLIATDPRSLLNNLSPSAQSNSSPGRPSPKTRTPEARRSLDYNTLRSSINNEQQPPIYKPQPTIVESPSRVKPSSSLSLSDTELDVKSQPLYKQAPIMRSLNEPVVLTVDASQRHSSFKDSEVPIKTSYVKSPVKVVCHSPHQQKSGDVPAADMSQYAHGGKVTIPVESVPRMNVSQGINHNNNDTQSSASPLESEVSVSTVAGSPVDPRSKAVETLVVREKNNPRSYVSFLAGEDESGSDVMKALDQSEIHVRQPKFDDTVISSIDGDSKLNSFADVTRKKKRKPRVVQSKYMPSAVSKTDQIPSTAKGTNQRGRRLGGSKPVTSTSKIEKAKAKSKTTSKMEKQKIEQADHERGKKPKFTSTPSDVAQPLTSVCVNIPEITPAPVRSFDEPAHFTFTTPTKDQSHKKKTNIKDVSHKESKSEQAVPSRATKQTSPDISQQQVDLYYARLCQWRFLRSKCKHTFEKQEKDAQEQLYSLWQLNEQLRSKKCEQLLELETKRKLEEIDRQLELQLSLLKAIDRNSSKLIPDYNSLYEGIDTTRHHMSVKDIILPENEADLLAALGNCENTLGEITSLLRDDEPKAHSFSGEMGVLAETLSEETKEHDRCMELLAAVSTLTTQEKSLQAELLQRKEP